MTFSFKRLHSDLQCKFNLRADVDFNLAQTATVSLHGIGGLTVSPLARTLRLLFANEPLLRVVTLQIGTNDLSSQSPKVVIGLVLDLVDYLRSVESSTAVGVCKVIPRRQRGTGYIFTVCFYSTIGSALRRHCVVLSAMLPCCLYVVCVCCHVLNCFHLPKIMIWSGLALPVTCFVLSLFYLPVGSVMLKRRLQTADGCLENPEHTRNTPEHPRNTPEHPRNATGTARNSPEQPGTTPEHPWNIP